jgi:hypothetical protein
MIIDGKKEALILREQIKKEIDLIKLKNTGVPGLTVILIGDFAPSQIYVKNKEKNSREVGIHSEVIKYSESVTENEVLNKIKELNENDHVSGILVQLPLQPALHFHHEKCPLPRCCQNEQLNTLFFQRVGHYIALSLFLEHHQWVFRTQIQSEYFLYSYL